jgi:Domain of unknown function (DUF4295)
MAKISKNARVAQRAQNAGTGREFVKVIKPTKDPVTGKYTYKEVMIHKDEAKQFFAKK